MDHNSMNFSSTSIRLECNNSYFIPPDIVSVRDGDDPCLISVIAVRSLWSVVLLQVIYECAIYGWRVGQVFKYYAFLRKRNAVNKMHQNYMIVLFGYICVIVGAGAYAQLKIIIPTWRFGYNQLINVVSFVHRTGFYLGASFGYRGISTEIDHHFPEVLPMTNILNKCVSPTFLLFNFCLGLLPIIAATFPENDYETRLFIAKVYWYGGACQFINYIIYGILTVILVRRVRRLLQETNRVSDNAKEVFKIYKNLVVQFFFTSIFQLCLFSLIATYAIEYTAYHQIFIMLSSIYAAERLFILIERIIFSSKSQQPKDNSSPIQVIDMEMNIDDANRHRIEDFVDEHLKQQLVFRITDVNIGKGFATKDHPTIIREKYLAIDKRNTCVPTKRSSVYWIVRTTMLLCFITGEILCVAGLVDVEASLVLSRVGLSLEIASTLGLTLFVFELSVLQRLLRTSGWIIRLLLTNVFFVALSSTLGWESGRTAAVAGISISSCTLYLAVDAVVIIESKESKSDFVQKLLSMLRLVFILSSCATLLSSYVLLQLDFVPGLEDIQLVILDGVVSWSVARLARDAMVFLVLFSIRDCWHIISGRSKFRFQNLHERVHVRIIRFEDEAQMFTRISRKVAPATKTTDFDQHATSLYGIGSAVPMSEVIDRNGALEISVQHRQSNSEDTTNVMSGFVDSVALRQNDSFAVHFFGRDFGSRIISVATGPRLNIVLLWVNILVLAVVEAAVLPNLIAPEWGFIVVMVLPYLVLSFLTLSQAMTRLLLKQFDVWADLCVALALSVIAIIVFDADCRSILVCFAFLVFLVKAIFRDARVTFVTPNDRMSQMIIPLSHIIVAHGIIYLPLLFLFGVIPRTSRNQFIQIRPGSKDYALISLYQSLVDFLFGLCIKVALSMIEQLLEGDRRYLQRIKAPLIPKFAVCEPERTVVIQDDGEDNVN
jgi:hypothetical protein